MTEQINKTITNLKKNNFNAIFCEDIQSAKEAALSIIAEGSTVAVGGSVTLNELGLLDSIKSGNYNYLDRNKEGLTRAEVEEIFRNSFFADYYLSSSNAVTEDGELYNVDGNSNRIAAIAFGPKKVIIIVGKNKIVKNLDEAVVRVKSISAPKNTTRLNCDTYCKMKGYCVSIENGTETVMGKGCNSDDRICVNTLISSWQRAKDRITVIIVNETLGY